MAPARAVSGISTPPRVAVVGAGIVGLATSYALMEAGAKVRCFEAETPMAARSVGDTRIFRLAHGDPLFVSYARRSLELWRGWERSSGRRFIGDEGAVVSGEEALGWYEAMRDADAPAQLFDEAASLRLPAPSPRGPFLFDPAGGAIRARAAGEFLLEAVGSSVVGGLVLDIDSRPAGAVVRFETPGRGEPDAWECDEVVIVAGLGTATLAARVGLAVSNAVEHHSRFTFQLADPGAAPPCWLDRSGWRAGLNTYAHVAAPGLWAVGGGAVDVDTRWEIGAEQAAANSRAAIVDYVRGYLPGVVPEIVDEIRCVPPLLGDSFDAVREGPVLAFEGGNLFKLAPLLGTMLANAALTGGALPSV